MPAVFVRPLNRPYFLLVTVTTDREMQVQLLPKSTVHTKALFVDPRGSTIIKPSHSTRDL